MSRTLTSSDRSALIRLASTLPVGSDERRAILAGLSDKSAAGSYPEGSGGVSVWVESTYDPGDSGLGAPETSREKKRFPTLSALINWMKSQEFGVMGRMKYHAVIPKWDIPGWVHEDYSSSHFDPRWGDLEGFSTVTRIGVMKDNKQPLTPQEIATIERSFRM